MTPKVKTVAPKLTCVLPLDLTWWKERADILKFFWGFLHMHCGKVTHPSTPTI